MGFERFYKCDNLDCGKIEKPDMNRPVHMGGPIGGSTGFVEGAFLPNGWVAIQESGHHLTFCGMGCGVAWLQHQIEREERAAGDA